MDKLKAPQNVAKSRLTDLTQPATEAAAPLSFAAFLRTIPKLVDADVALLNRPSPRHSRKQRVTFA